MSDESNGSAKIIEKGAYEEEIEEVLSVFKTSRLPLDNFYYDVDQKRFMLVSHVFNTLDHAKLFERDLRDAFPLSDYFIKDDHEGRYYIHLDPATIDKETFARFISLYRVSLFETNKAFFNPKSRLETKGLLDDLRFTQIPMDACYWNYENNVYYLASHVFHDYPSVQRYQKIFQDNFGVHATDVLEDVSGRYFLNLDPSSILKERFKLFLEAHRIELFSERTGEDARQQEGFYESTLDHSRYILNTLRRTDFPLDNIVYDKKYDAYYLVSHVFSDERKAKEYSHIFKQAFGSTSTLERNDLESRWYVFLDVASINQSEFESFVGKDKLREIEMPIN